MCEKAVFKNSFVIEYVPEKYKTEEMCEYAADPPDPPIRPLVPKVLTAFEIFGISKNVSKKRCRFLNLVM